MFSPLYSLDCPTHSFFIYWTQHHLTISNALQCTILNLPHLIALLGRPNAPSWTLPARQAPYGPHVYGPVVVHCKFNQHTKTMHRTLQLPPVYGLAHCNFLLNPALNSPHSLTNTVTSLNGHAVSQQCHLFMVSYDSVSDIGWKIGALIGYFRFFRCKVNFILKISFSRKKLTQNQNLLILFFFFK